MSFTHEVEGMICVAQGANHGPAPIPEEGRWVKAKEVKDISGLTQWKTIQLKGTKTRRNPMLSVSEMQLCKILGSAPRHH